MKGKSRAMHAPTGLSDSIFQLQVDTASSNCNRPHVFTGKKSPGIPGLFVNACCRCLDEFFHLVTDLAVAQHD